jgi:hypothetical protein
VKDDSDDLTRATSHRARDLVEELLIKRQHERFEIQTFPPDSKLRPGDRFPAL